MKYILILFFTFTLFVCKAQIGDSISWYDSTFVNRYDRVKIVNQNLLYFKDSICDMVVSAVRKSRTVHSNDSIKAVRIRIKYKYYLIKYKINL